MERNVAVIPARGGSRRIPRKNVRPFNGRPMLGYAVEVATASGLFERVVVSTDDDEVAEVARGLGAEVPFRRPVEISDDHTPMAEVVLHAIDELVRTGGPGEEYDNVCTLFATAPFLRVADLVAGLRLLDEGAPAAVAVTGFDFPIFRAFGLTDDGALRPLWPEHAAARSQDLPEALHDAGQFYWTRVDVLRTARSLWPEGMRPVRLPRHRVQDIDEPEDWERAERMHRSQAPEAAVAGELVLRPATSDDAARLLEWRNHPTTRAASLSTAEIDLDTHRAWLADRLRDPDCRLLIVVHDGEPVGQLRLDRDDTTAEVSIGLAPQAQGRGLGTQALRLLDAEAAAWPDVRRLTARVRAGNVASARAFRSAGYREHDRDEDTTTLVRDL